MILLEFIFSLMAGVMLMLVSINMVRSSVKKAYGGLIANVLMTKYGNIRAVALGAVLAIAMQGATAVIVLTSGLVATGIIPLAVALAVAIGADVGSAIVLRVLTFDISGFIPVLLAIGGWMHLKSDSAHRKHIGHILFGMGLIILSLQLLKSAIAPVASMPFFMDIAYYFESDLLLAFIVGAVLTFAMHSSVASILTLVTLVHTGSLSAVSGIAFILGANLGSAFIAYWMTRGGEKDESTVPKLIMILRGVMAIMCVLVLIGIVRYAPDMVQGYLFGLQEQSLIYTHMVFNFALMVWIPFIPKIINIAQQYDDPIDTQMDTNGILSIAQREGVDSVTIHGYVSKEILFMLDTLANSVSLVEESYRNYNNNITECMQKSHTNIQQRVEDLKQFYTDIPEGTLTKDEARKIREYISYAVELSKASELISGVFMDLAKEKYTNKILFSEKGWQEIKVMYEQLRQGTLLMFDVLMGNRGGDNQTDEITKQQQIMQGNYQKSLHRHLKRLSVGDTVTAHSSNMHLKTVSNIYEIHNTILSLPTHIKQGTL